MKLLFSVVCIFGFAFLFAWNAQAEMLYGGMAPTLTHSTLSDEAANYLATFCDVEAKTFVPPSASQCKEVINGTFYTQTSFDFCKENSKSKGMPFSYFVTCMRDLGHRDYSPEYLKACAKVKYKNLPTIKSSPQECLNYLAQSNSSFNAEIFEICLATGENDLPKSKPCLNAIRDRELDVQKVRRDCLSHGKVHAETLSCIEKLSDAAPLSCNPPRSAKGSRVGSASGVR